MVRILIIICLLLVFAESQKFYYENLRHIYELRQTLLKDRKSELEFRIFVLSRSKRTDMEQLELQVLQERLKEVQNGLRT